MRPANQPRSYIVDTPREVFILDITGLNCNAARDETLSPTKHKRSVLYILSDSAPHVIIPDYAAMTRSGIV